MSPTEIALSDDFLPPKSDIILKIDFDPRSDNAAHVFELAADLIRSLQAVDDVLIQSIDSKIETTMILEDLQKSSLKIFLRNVLNTLDDEALRELDWKKQVGQFLVKGKYAALRYLDGEAPKNGARQLSDLTDEIAKLAMESDVRHLPDYPRPNPTRFSQALDRVQEVKEKFGPNESLTITLGKDEYRVDLGKTWLPSDFIHSDEGEERQLSNEMDMILIIKKPDFLGSAQWQFKHGKSSINATIEHKEWLERFHSGEFPLCPGDALRVRLRSDYSYNEKGDLIDTKLKIVHVFEVEQGPKPQDDLFDK